MKKTLRYDDYNKHNRNQAYRSKPKDRKKERKRWHTINQAFRCGHCQQMVFPDDYIGTTQRNHCPHCLWSRHVDTKPGNRASTCHGGMDPIGLTFKHNGFDKYGRARSGDVMIIHLCRSCGEINLNRIAGDDRTDMIFKTFRNGACLSKHLQERLKQLSIDLLSTEDEERLSIALYGKSYRKSTLAEGP